MLKICWGLRCLGGEKITFWDNFLKNQDKKLILVSFENYSHVDSKNILFYYSIP